MNLKRMLVILGFSIAGILRWWAAQQRGREFLIVWGARGTECLLTSIEPRTGESLGHLSFQAQKGSCNLGVSKMEDGERVVYVQATPAKIETYRIGRNGNFSLEQEYGSDNMEITAWAQPTQWTMDGQFFFSAIQNGREQIFSLDSKGGDVIPVTNFDGMTYDPLVSPDGRYLAFRLNEDVSNRYDYAVFESCAGTYYVMNIEAGIYIDMASFSEDAFVSQCGLQWSPDSRYVAIRSGGRLGIENQSILIVDAMTNKLVSTIESGFVPPQIDFFGWLNESALLYHTLENSATAPLPINRYYLFEVEEQTTTVLADFPELVAPEARFSFVDVTWPEDGHYLVGTGFIEDGATLTIVEMDEDNHPIAYTGLTGSRPLASPSGDWIGYQAGEMVGILDTTTGSSVEYRLLEVLEKYELAWMRPYGQSK